MLDDEDNFVQIKTNIAMWYEQLDLYIFDIAISILCTKQSKKNTLNLSKYL